MPRSAPSCYARALDALARRARSTSDLSRWLRERGYPPEEIAGAVERLTAAGLLDDARFAESFARSRLVDRKLSRRRVLAELSRHGIARDVAEAAVAAVLADEGVDESATLAAVAARKMRALSALAPDAASRRLTAFLARRGYDADDVRRVVAQLIPR
jgi:regulatory protein